MHAIAHRSGAVFHPFLSRRQTPPRWPCITQYGTRNTPSENTAFGCERAKETRPITKKAIFAARLPQPIPLSKTVRNAKAAAGSSAYDMRFGYKGPNVKKPHGNVPEARTQAAPHANTDKDAVSRRLRRANMLRGRTMPIRTAFTAFAASAGCAPTACATIATRQCQADG